jgi:uncharacterized paraquat-inducible protein A
MRRALLAAAAVLMLTVAGCENGKMKMPWDKDKDHATTMSAAHDDCPMCPGVQTADANGYCPKCHMKVKG